MDETTKALPVTKRLPKRAEIELDGNGRYIFFSAFVATQSPTFAIDLVASPDHQPWGRIPDCLAPYPDGGVVPAGEIVLPVGNRAEGLNHVLEKHAQKIIQAHPGLSIEAYLQNVLRHFQRIYRQQDGSLWLFRTNGITKCAVVAPIQISGRLLYKLITAYPIPREPNFARRDATRLYFK